MPLSQPRISRDRPKTLFPLRDGTFVIGSRSESSWHIASRQTVALRPRRQFRTPAVDEASKRGDICRDPVVFCKSGVFRTIQRPSVFAKYSTIAFTSTSDAFAP